MQQQAQQVIRFAAVSFYCVFVYFLNLFLTVPVSAV